LFSLRNSFTVRRAAVAALLATAAASAAANVLVVRSAGPSAKAYPAGRSIPDNARITLQAGDSVTVLGPGGTRSFRGPGNFSPNASTSAGATTLASNDGRRARIGAVRSAGIVPHPTTIWDVDVTQGGTICLAGTDNVMLWRPDSSVATTVTVTGPNGRAQNVRWPAGEATIAWPSAGSIANGASYTFAEQGVAVPTRITFRTLTTEPTNLQAVAAALIENGCQDQLDLLVETQPDLSPAG